MANNGTAPAGSDSQSAGVKAEAPVGVNPSNRTVSEDVWGQLGSGLTFSNRPPSVNGAASSNGGSGLAVGAGLITFGALAGLGALAGAEMRRRKVTVDQFTSGPGMASRG